MSNMTPINLNLPLGFFSLSFNILSFEMRNLPDIKNSLMNLQLNEP